MRPRSANQTSRVTAATAKSTDLALRRADGTLADAIEVSVRESILAGKYLPGQKLPITTMAREHFVSLSVMREALTRLTADGLVTSEAMHGFSVMQATVVDLEEVTALLKMLLADAVLKSILAATPEWEGSLLAAHHRFKRAVTGQDIGSSRSVDVDQAHTHFVNVLTSNCGNDRLINLLTSLQRSMRLYHRLAIRLLKSEASERVVAYRKVTRCAVDGNHADAVRLMMDDISTAAATCRNYLVGSS